MYLYCHVLLCVPAQAFQIEPLSTDVLEGAVSKMKSTLRRGGEKAERKAKD